MHERQTLCFLEEFCLLLRKTDSLYSYNLFFFQKEFLLITKLQFVCFKTTSKLGFNVKPVCLFRFFWFVGGLRRVLKNVWEEFEETIVG